MIFVLLILLPLAAWFLVGLLARLQEQRRQRGDRTFSEVLAVGGMVLKCPCPACLAWRRAHHHPGVR